VSLVDAVDVDLILSQLSAIGLGQAMPTAMPLCHFRIARSIRTHTAWSWWRAKARVLLAHQVDAMSPRPDLLPAGLRTTPSASWRVLAATTLV